MVSQCQEKKDQCRTTQEIGSSVSVPANKAVPSEPGCICHEQPSGESPGPICRRHHQETGGPLMFFLDSQPTGLPFPPVPRQDPKTKMRLDPTTEESQGDTGVLYQGPEEQRACPTGPRLLTGLRGRMEQAPLR